MKRTKNGVPIIGIPFIKKLLLAANLFLFLLHTQASASPSSSVDSTNNFVSICYHDIRAANSNAFGVTPKNLAEQFQYLKDNFNVISLQDVQDASAGVKSLPKKAVLITFDDGLLSFYEEAYPLIKKYKFPVVLAVVGKWTDEGLDTGYGLPNNESAKMATWKQLKEMSDSGLVLIASHSYNLHQGHVFNPQGNEAPQAGFFTYDSTTKSYETEDNFFNRVQTDLARNKALLRQYIGLIPPVMVWPYGSFNGLSIKAATQVGLPIQFSILGGFNNAKNLQFIHRGMILSHMSLADFAKGLESGFDTHTDVRSISVDIDSFWSPHEQERNDRLGAILEQVYQLRPNVAIVPAFSKNDESYFPSSKVFTRGDYLSRVVHTLANRARVSFVYASVPLSVLRNQEHARGVMQDLAKHTDMDGLFFEANEETKINTELLALAIKTAQEVHPEWRFGVRGFVPMNLQDFAYVMTSYPTVNSSTFKNFLKTSPQAKAKIIVALNEETTVQLKQDVEKSIKEGFRHFHYDKSVNLIKSNVDLKIVFATKQSVYELPRGVAK